MSAPQVDLTPYLNQVKIPNARSQVYKDECIFCFDNQESEGGLFTCLDTHKSYCQDHLQRVASLGLAAPLYLNVKRIKTLKKEEESDGNTTEEGTTNQGTDGEPPKKKPIRLAIGVEGGFDIGTKSYDIHDTESVYCLPTNTYIPFPNDSLPEKVKAAVTGILTHQSVQAQEAISAWEADNQPLAESKHARDLKQLDNGVKIAPTGHKCSQCDLDNNLYLCLTCGEISCGRKNWDGSGGNGHALVHFDNTGHPIAVKLGTITPEGKADIYSYAEQDMVLDPHLKDHLAHFGINIMDLRKTDKTLAEMELDSNLSYDFGRISEKGKVLKPMYGPGYTGLVNMGNSCYLASVIQTVFSIPEFRQRYYDNYVKIVGSALFKDPTACLETQLGKLAYGIHSGKYSVPSSTKKFDKNDQNEEVQDEQQGIALKSFKSLVGKGHSEFATNRQQDALEYFQHLLSMVERQEKISGIPKEKDVSRVFKFRVEERVQDTETGQVKYTYRDDNVLSLPIPLEEAINKEEVQLFEEEKKRVEAEGKKMDRMVRPHVPLQSCLNAFFADELVEDFYSSALGRKTNALKRTRLATFPDYLVLQMRRFVLDGWVPKKMDVFIDVKDNIELDSMRGQGPQPDEVLLPDVSLQPPKLVIDESIVTGLMDMGFPRVRSEKAAHKTNNAGIEQAMNWLIEHMEDADIDVPLEQPSQGTKSGKPQADPEAVENLTAMGFTHKQAQFALQQTQNNVDRAVDYLFSHTEDLDALIAVEESSSSSSSAPAQKKDERNPEGLKDGSAKYELAAFITHIGTSTSCGHYVCHIKNTDGKWVLFDDTKVALSDEPPKDMAYMYFYRRVQQ